MAVRIRTLTTVTIAVSGTPQTISSTVEDRAASVLIQAHPSNSSFIWIGDSTIAVNKGISLQPGESVEIAGSERPSGTDEFYIDEIFVDATTGGDRALITAFGRR